MKSLLNFDRINVGGVDLYVGTKFAIKDDFQRRQFIVTSMVLGKTWSYKATSYDSEEWTQTITKETVPLEVI